MNEEIIFKMIEPFNNDNSITYKDFDKIFYMLSHKEQYEIVEILYNKGIDLVDEQKDEKYILDIIDDTFDKPNTANDFTFDKTIFQDTHSLIDTMSMTAGDIKQSNEILCALIQQGNKQAVQDLCIKNKRLVDKYVLKYQGAYGHRLEFKDLEQVGYLGLMKAAERFDLNHGTAFSTYAVWWIKQSISREIMDHGYTIRIPVHMMERINKILFEDNKLVEQQIPYKQRIEILVNELDFTEEQIEECLILKNNFIKYTSLDLPVGEDHDTQLSDFIEDSINPSLEELIWQIFLKEEITSCLEMLNEREEKILRLRYGLNDGKCRTLEEVGSIFKVTRERIRQIENKALKKLRNSYITKEKLIDFL